MPVVHTAWSLQTETQRKLRIAREKKMPEIAQDNIRNHTL